MTDSPMLLLGMDLLGAFDTLIINYRIRQMQVRLSRGQLPP